MSRVQDAFGLTHDGARISFAQNGEDVRLWRALDSVEEGFYVEVGGWDPVEDSVSRSFYLRGWSGLVLEAVPENCERYREIRPRDRVMAVVAASKEGFVDFYSVAMTGLSTSSTENAARYGSNGRDVQSRRLPARRLDSILAEIDPPIIHFMIVDVEGSELDVLRGMDFTRYRPWIVLVEATIPGTKNVTSLEWESILLDAGYVYSAFDGLNRYYVASERADLSDAVSLSPNVFDAFRPAKWQLTEHDLRHALEAGDQALQEAQEARAEGERRAHEARVESLEREQTLQALLAQSRLRFRELESQAASASVEAEQREAAAAEAVSRALGERDALQKERDAVRATLDGVLASRSWRLTKPLRRLAGG